MQQQQRQQPQHHLNTPTNNTSQHFHQYQQVKRRRPEYAIQRVVLPLWSAFELAERALCANMLVHA